MASYIVDLDNNDDLMRIIQKCNRNFRLLATDQTRQSTSGIDAVASAIYSYVDDRIDSLGPISGGITGVKGEMQPDYTDVDEEGRVSISLEETGERVTEDEISQTWNELWNNG